MDPLEKLGVFSSIKRMIEKKDQTELDSIAEREKRFIADATKAYYKEAHVTGIQAYHPEDIIEFLGLNTEEIQTRMGGEWLLMDKAAFEAFAFTMKRKIQKSMSLIDWDNE